MSYKKQLTINFIAQVLFSIINLGISFFLVPHIIKSINASAYAFISLSNDFVNYASLITVALNSIAGRYITLEIHKKNYDDANIYYNSVIVANIVMAIILLVPMIIFVVFIDSFLNVPINILTDVRILFIIVFANFVISLITSVFSSATFVTNKLYLSSIASIISQIVRCIILIVLFSLFNTNVWFVGLASLISTLIIAVFNYVFTKKLLPNLKFDLKKANLKYIFEMLKNGVWNSVNKLSGILQTGLDLLLSNIFIGSIAMGIISLPRTITSIVFSLFSSISSIFNPNIMQAYANNDFQSIKKQLSFVMKFTGTLSNTFIAVFITMGLSFYRLWVPSQDISFLYLLSFISMCSLTIELPMEPVYCVHTSANKIKQPAIVCLVLSIITILVVIGGIHIFDSEKIQMIIIYGTSTVFGLVRVLFYIPIYTAKIMEEKWSMLYPGIFRNVLIVAITSLIGIFLRKYLAANTWIAFFVSCILLALLFLIVNFVLNFNKEEKKEFLNVFKKITSFIN